MTARASNNIPPSLRKAWQEEEDRLSALRTSDNPSSATTMSSSAKAIVCHDTHANNGWKLQDVHVRKPKEGELLVEMVASGICHTDVLIGGLPNGASPIAFYPRVLGHEGSGYVKEVGPGVTVAAAGDPVLLSFAFCNTCSICKAGHHSHCNDFMPLNFGDMNRSFGSSEGKDDIGGCFFGQSSFGSLSIVQQCSVVNAKDLVKSKEELQLFAPLGCGIQTGSGTVVNAAKATPEDLIVINGLGGVGLSAVMGAAVQGCKTIIGIDIVESRLKLAKEMGATHVINGKDLPDGKELADVVREMTEGQGPTISVDTTGVPALINGMVSWTRNRGKIVQVGSPPFDFKLEIPMFEFMASGKQLIGAIEGQAYPPDYVPKMIQWYREGRFPIDKMMKLIKAEDFEQGLKEMHDGTTIKPIMCWS